MTTCCPQCHLDCRTWLRFGVACPAEPIAELPLNYAGPLDPNLRKHSPETGTPREVAAYVRNRDLTQYGGREWLYHSRGTAPEVVPALRRPNPGYIGGLGSHDVDDVRFILDRSNRGVGDIKDLCWSGPMLTVAEFLTWFRGAK
jgi:hypothetical protein